MKNYDVVIIGGGPAGMAAAVEAKKNGADVLILERDNRLGGILNQCIHNGFGLHYFKEELTGPEYAARFKKMVEECGADVVLEAMVLEISKDKSVTFLSPKTGLETVQAKAIVLAMGCRERTAGAIQLTGTRPAGVYTAGMAQRLSNVEGYLVGKKVVILGSGDIGLIMARRMTLEGAHVQVVAELMPYSGGLKRNIVQCLEDYGIPLKLCHTVIDIKGKQRLEGVTLAEVDENGRPIPGTEEEYCCDTLLLSCGLIPENELSQGMGVRMNPVTNGPVVDESLETSIPGVFACGNVLHVHDLVDFVSEEAKCAGECAADYILGQLDKAGKRGIAIEVEGGIRYTVPAEILPERMRGNLKVRFRVGNVYRNCYISVYLDEKRIAHKRKQIVTPGEMEEVILEKEQLEGASRPEKIRIVLECGEKQD